MNLRGKVLEASKKARLFGGAALFIGVGYADPSRPLDIERVGKGGLKHLTVLTRRQLAAGEIERDPTSEWYGKPKFYTLTGASGAQVAIHPSRLVIFNGAMVPDEDFGGALGQGSHGWGESVLTATLDAIKNADSTAANIASLVFEAKIDIIKVPQFSRQPGLRRSHTAPLFAGQHHQGVNGTLILDAEEEYDSKSASFSGLTDILMAFLQIVSGAADIPVTRLLGQSPAGLNATGDADMRNYHDRIQAIQELDFTPAMSRLDECLIRSATGARDPDIYASWAPLEQMSEKDKAEIFKTKADAARVLFGSSAGQEIIPRQALSEALVNTLVDDGSLPGLEAAIAAFGGSVQVDQPEPSSEEAGREASVPDATSL